ncbi:MAG: hypothetical protein IKA61_06250 [Clostridia bacterium]|nr:hypothetical protein [Clostridia bacterium]
MQRNKIYSYVGFARRAGKFKAGMNAIKTVKKGVELLILCKSASPNAVKEAKNLSERFFCPLYMTKAFTVEEMVDKENCKLVAILDCELAKAIISNAGEDLEEISGGRNE